VNPSDCHGDIIFPPIAQSVLPKQRVALSMSCNSKMRHDLPYIRQSSMSICCKPLLVLLILFIIGCSSLGHTTKKPFERDPFHAFTEKYRRQALEHEKMRELHRALICWQIVRSFKPDDNEASERIDTLRARTRVKADDHFLKGSEYLRDHETQAARREFLKALTYDPDHEQALDYIRNEVTKQDFLMYETRAGDTLRKIADEVYNDPKKDFLVAYFNELDTSTRLTSGLILKLPIIEAPLTAQPVYAEDMLNMAKALFKARQYQETLSIAREILAYDPTNSEAGNLLNASNYHLGRRFIRQKRYLDALRLFESFDSDYRNVREIVEFLRNNLYAQAEVHYKTGMTYFLAEELDRAIEEWQETLRLNPAHGRAKRDLEKAQRLLDKLRTLD